MNAKNGDREKEGTSEVYAAALLSVLGEDAGRLVLRRCAGITKAGARCKSYSLPKGSEFCLNHDPAAESALKRAGIVVAMQLGAANRKRWPRRPESIEKILRITPREP